MKRVVRSSYDANGKLIREWVEVDPGYIEAFRGLTQLIASDIKIGTEGSIYDMRLPSGWTYIAKWQQMFIELTGDSDGKTESQKPKQGKTPVSQPGTQAG